MSEGRSKVPRGLFLVVIVLQVALGILLAQLYLSSHHTLYNNGHWTPTKTTLPSGVMGSFAFLFSRQPLADGQLNLAAWHGYQEVVLKRELDRGVGIWFSEQQGYDA